MALVVGDVVTVVDVVPDVVHVDDTEEVAVDVTETVAVLLVVAESVGVREAVRVVVRDGVRVSVAVSDVDGVSDEAADSDIDKLGEILGNDEAEAPCRARKCPTLDRRSRPARRKKLKHALGCMRANRNETADISTGMPPYLCISSLKQRSLRR